MSRKKTKNGWEKAKIHLQCYLDPLDEIDEELYNYLGEVVAPEWCTQGFIQLGKAQYEKNGIYYHDTGMQVGDKYYYLGALPSFNGPDK